MIVNDVQGQLFEIAVMICIGRWRTNRTFVGIFRGSGDDVLVLIGRGIDVELLVVVLETPMQIQGFSSIALIRAQRTLMLLDDLSRQELRRWLKLADYLTSWMSDGHVTNHGTMRRCCMRTQWTDKTLAIEVQQDMTLDGRPIGTLIRTSRTEIVDSGTFIRRWFVMIAVVIIVGLVSINVRDHLLRCYGLIIDCFDTGRRFERKIQGCIVRVRVRRRRCRQQ